MASGNVWQLLETILASQTMLALVNKSKGFCSACYNAEDTLPATKNYTTTPNVSNAELEKLCPYFLQILNSAIFLLPLDAGHFLQNHTRGKEKVTFNRKFNVLFLSLRLRNPVLLAKSDSMYEHMRNFKRQ